MNNKSKNRIIVALLVSLSMIITTVGYAFAGTDGSLENVGTEIVDEVTENIVRDGTFNEKQNEKIAEDVECLDSLGIPIGDIKNVSEKDGNIIYQLLVTKDITDEIMVEKNNAGDILMYVTEGDKNDKLVMKADGTVFLDGKEVIYDVRTVDSSITEEPSELSVTPSTGGIQWYSVSSAPSELKKDSYKAYSESWRCSNISLQKALGSIAYATIIGLVTGGPSGGAVGFTTTAFYELVNYDPNSKNISYIDYTAKSKNYARHFKGRRYTYSKKNFKGKKTTTYSYGLMM